MTTQSTTARLPEVLLTATMAVWSCTPAACQTAVETLANRAIGEEIVWTARNATTKLHRAAIGLSGPWGFAHVDSETGLLLSVLRRRTGGRNSEGDPRISSEEDAERVARAFLSRAGIAMDSTWSLVRREYITRGEAQDGSREYVLEWRRFFEGIQLPAFIVVWVDADTGQIYDYGLLDDPVRVSLKPSVTPEQAVAIVVRHEGWRHYTVESVRPVVSSAPEPPWRQRLVWRVAVRNRDATEHRLRQVEADVDTTTGEVVRILHPASSGRPSAARPRAARPAIAHVNWQKARASDPPPTVFETLPPTARPKLPGS